MVNNLEFVNRLKKILEQHQLTASSFADLIDVQRSSISHILSGRNKPSLDFVLKVTSKFTDVDIYWLLNGNGVYPKKVKNTAPIPSESFVKDKSKIEHINSTEKLIKRIIIIYNDGTFEEYKK